ncbi:MAG: NADH-quinone oxidoreductase subunit M, partial [Clostridia bacterium]|nr:NADH-quinone oxidoreductase subunit M [Clostridia bacterium]
VVVTAIYVLRVFKHVFLGPRQAQWDHLRDAHGAEVVPIAVLCSVLILFGILPSPLVDVIQVSVGSLVAKLESAVQIGGIF